MLSKIAAKTLNLLRRSSLNYGITPQFMHPLDADLLLD
jgi:hypothetical protein